MTITLGTAPDSWGVWFASDPQQVPWQRFLDEVADVGYRRIELGPLGYLPRDVRALEHELRDRDLHLTAGGVMLALEDASSFVTVREELDELCGLLARLSAPFLLVIDDVFTDLRTGAPVGSAELDDRGWEELIRTTERIAEVADMHGLKTLLHPHAETHVEREDQIERFLGDVSTNVGLCLDVGHHAYAYGDPVAFFAQHHARIPYLHLKDVDLVVRQQIADEELPFARAVAEGVFVEPSKGVVDFLSLRTALEATGYDGFGIVEQDMYPAPPDSPLPIARSTRSYLEHIGLGEVGTPDI